MCLQKYNTKYDDIFGGYSHSERSAIEHIQFFCTFSCAYPLLKMDEVKIKNTTIDFTMVENICLALENHSKNSVRTKMLKFSHFYWKLRFCSKFEILKSFHFFSINQNECFTKFNTSLTKVNRTGIDLQKHKCALS